jgi:hypothetical protein
MTKSADEYEDFLKVLEKRCLCAARNGSDSSESHGKSWEFMAKDIRAFLDTNNP